jgi:hypothetical protein
MRKPKEIEELIKRAIRDEIALRPLISIAQLQSVLHRQGYFHVNALDWHYVAKLTKQVRLENLAMLLPQDRAERFAMVKERHRILTEKLSKIVDGEPATGFDKPIYPNAGERIAAANTIMKWDVALLYAEEQLKEIEKAEMKGPIKVHPIVLELPSSTSPDLLKSSTLQSRSSIRSR